MRGSQNSLLCFALLCWEPHMKKGKLGRPGEDACAGREKNMEKIFAPEKLEQRNHPRLLASSTGEAKLPSAKES